MACFASFPEGGHIILYWLVQTQDDQNFIKTGLDRLNQIIYVQNQKGGSVTKATEPPFT